MSHTGVGVDLGRGEGEKQTTMRMKTAKGRRGSADEKHLTMRMNTAMVMAAIRWQ